VVTGANAAATVNAATLSHANSVILFGGAGEDVLTGGAGNDIFKFSAAALASTDIVNGGNGADELLMTSAGTVRAAKVSGVETYVLAGGGSNSLTLSAANFAGLGGPLTVDGGSKGNRLSAAGLAAADRAVLKGGAGADTLIAGQNAVMVGGGGKDVFEFTTPGSAKAPDTNTITDFTHGADKLAFSKKGFALGAKPSAATLFTANNGGHFTKTAQRFAYDTATGALYYDAHGSATPGSRLKIAALTHHPILAASDLTFVA
jgi:Ca2+-binding RTX toxin-like protein